MPGVRQTEEPACTVIARAGEAEIRRYAARLIAEVEVTDEEEAARNRGFRPLAAYIFGANTEAARIGMTAPVAQRGGAGRWVIGFLMPAR